MSEQTLGAGELRDLLAVHVARAGCVNSFAALAGVRPAHIDKVRAGKHEPCAALLRALGLRRVSVYEVVKSYATSPSSNRCAGTKVGAGTTGLRAQSLEDGELAEKSPPGTPESLAADFAEIGAASASASAVCRRAGRAITGAEIVLARRAKARP